MTGKPALALVVAAILGMIGGGRAHADPFKALSGYACPADGAEVPRDQIVGYLLLFAKIPVDQTVIGKMTGGGFGDYVQEQSQKNPKSYGVLWIRTDELVQADRNVTETSGTPSEFSIQTPKDAPAVDARAFLNGAEPWFKVICHKSAGDEGGPRTIAVGKTVDDVTLRGFDKRDFATVSYSSDRDDKKDTIEVDLSIGAPLLGDPKKSATPFGYLSYQRKTGDDPIDDLTFGLSWKRFVGPYQDRVRFSLEYLTDDRFESQGYRGELKLEHDLGCAIPSGGRGSVDEGLQCLVFAAIDHIETDDPGRKTTLVNAPDFTRYGGALELTYWRNLANGAQVRLTGGYEVREPFDHEDGDAAVGRLKVAFVPDPEGHFEFGVEYEEGEDVTSLVRSNTIKAKIGYRR